MTASGDLSALRERVAELGSVVVGFSGGADSAFLAWVAHDVLGDRALAVTAVSASLPGDELDACRDLAASWGMRWQQVTTDELDRVAYRRNGPDRCAHCKDALLDAAGPIAEAEGATVVLGVNVDDLGDHRPGQAAAAARGSAFPLVEAGFTKAQVRATSRALGLTTWDKPAAACLASRIPHGTTVTVPLLGRVERAEAGLQALGFASLRVRHHGDIARVELPLADLPVALERREEIVAVVRKAGWRFVTLDLEGLRSGSLTSHFIADRAAG
jgi:uncharacterized protein